MFASSGRLSAFAEPRPHLVVDAARGELAPPGDPVGNEFGIPLDRRRAEASGHGHRGDIVRSKPSTSAFP
jgi:hypothetical protein